MLHLLSSDLVFSHMGHMPVLNTVTLAMVKGFNPSIKGCFYYEYIV